MFCHRIIEVPAVDVDDMKMPLFEEEGGAPRHCWIELPRTSATTPLSACYWLVVKKTQILVLTLRYPLMDFRRDVNYFTVCQS